MDLLQDAKLLYKCEDLIPANELIKENSIILYYFTSENCDVSRVFDKKLKTVYETATDNDVQMLVIVIYCEENRAAMIASMKQNYPDWYAIPFEDEIRRSLKYNFEITHTPVLIAVRSNGEIITKKGVMEIENIGINVLITWSGYEYERKL